MLLPVITFGCKFEVWRDTNGQFWAGHVLSGQLEGCVNTSGLETLGWTLLSRMATTGFTNEVGFPIASQTLALAVNPAVFRPFDAAVLTYTVENSSARALNVVTTAVVGQLS